jgi:hypothetical protein
MKIIIPQQEVTEGETSHARDFIRLLKERFDLVTKRIRVEIGNVPIF